MRMSFLQFKSTCAPGQTLRLPLFDLASMNCSSFWRRLVPIPIMAPDSATESALPICSACVCQTIGVYTPRPPRGICHGVAPYVSMTAHTGAPGTRHGHLKPGPSLQDRLWQRLRPSEPRLAFRSIPLLRRHPWPPPPYLSTVELLLLCCPINHTALINRPTLPAAPAPHLGPPCCPAGTQRTPEHALMQT